MSAPASLYRAPASAEELTHLVQTFIATPVGADVISRITGLPPNTMWARDVPYSAQAVAVDGTRCAVDGSADLTKCGQGGTMCNWRFIQVDRACDATAYLQVMFQADRYLWCQTQLASLLAATPGGQQAATATPAYASAWVDWCRKVMQLVSMARWATNITPGYLPDVNEMPAAAAVIQQALTDHAAIDLRGAQAPSMINGAMLGDQLLFSLFKPCVRSVPYNANFSFPRTTGDFDPVMLCNMDLVDIPLGGPHVLDATGRGVPLNYYSHQSQPVAQPVKGMMGGCVPIKLTTTQAYPGTTTCSVVQVWGDQRVDGMAPGTGGSGLGVSSAHAPWPASWVPVTSADSRVERRMYLWFNATLGTSDFVKSRGMFYARNTAVSLTRTPTNFWWGSADLQIKLCMAWAQDVINTSFERMVANGFQAYLDTMAVIPPQYQNLTADNLTAIRAALSEQAFTNVTEVVTPIFGLAAGIAAAIPGVGAIVGAVIAAVGALIEALAKLLSGAMASGSFGWELACIPPPVMRMIKSTTDQACDFDPSDGHVAAVVSRATAVQAAADAGLPVAVWHDVAQTASPPLPGAGLPSFGPLVPNPGAIQQPGSKAGWWFLGIAALAVGGVVVYKATR